MCAVCTVRGVRTRCRVNLPLRGVRIMSHRITPSTDDATGSPITEINRALGKRREPPSPLRQHAKPKALIACGLAQEEARC